MHRIGGAGRGTVEIVDSGGEGSASVSVEWTSGEHGSGDVPEVPPRGRSVAVVVGALATIGAITALALVWSGRGGAPDAASPEPTPASTSSSAPPRPSSTAVPSTTLADPAAGWSIETIELAGRLGQVHRVGEGWFASLDDADGPVSVVRSADGFNWTTVKPEIPGDDLLGVFEAGNSTADFFALIGGYEPDGGSYRIGVWTFDGGGGWALHPEYRSFILEVGEAVVGQPGLGSPPQDLGSIGLVHDGETFTLVRTETDLDASPSPAVADLVAPFVPEVAKSVCSAHRVGSPGSSTIDSIEFRGCDNQRVATVAMDEVSAVTSVPDLLGCIEVARWSSAQRTSLIRLAPGLEPDVFELERVGVYAPVVPVGGDLLMTLYGFSESLEDGRCEPDAATGRQTLHRWNPESGLTEVAIDLPLPPTGGFLYEGPDGTVLYHSNGRIYRANEELTALELVATPPDGNAFLAPMSDGRVIGYGIDVVYVGSLESDDDAWAEIPASVLGRGFIFAVTDTHVVFGDPRNGGRTISRVPLP